MSIGRYVKVFFAHNGFGPYVCNFCDHPVCFDDVHVHHLDHDRFNDSVSNLVASHESCHIAHHVRLRQTGAKHSEETKAKMRESAKSRKWSMSEQGRANVAAANRRRVHSLEERARRSAALKGKKKPAGALEKAWKTRRERYGPNGRSTSSG